MGEEGTGRYLFQSHLSPLLKRSEFFSHRPRRKVISCRMPFSFLGFPCPPATHSFGLHSLILCLSLFPLPRWGCSHQSSHLPLISSPSVGVATKIIRLPDISSPFSARVVRTAFIPFNDCFCFGWDFHFTASFQYCTRDRNLLT